MGLQQSHAGYDRGVDGGEVIWGVRVALIAHILSPCNLPLQNVEEPESPLPFFRGGLGWGKQVDESQW